MIPYNELRLGNKFYYLDKYKNEITTRIGTVENLHIKETYRGEIICLINPELTSGAYYESDYMDSDINHTNVNPIELSDNMFKKFPQLKDFPHIKYVHQFQNWYFFNYNKEIEVEL